MNLNRRDLTLSFGALWGTLAIPGAALAQKAMMSWKPRALTLIQAGTLEAAAEIIMPATDTPGAGEAGVPAFVDRALADYSTPADAKAVRDGLDRLEADARAAHGAGFAGLTTAQQTAILERHEIEGRAPRTPAAAVGRGETETGLSNQPRSAIVPPKGPAFFPVLRDLVTVGYFTSKPGATKAVRYDPNPGAYRGCVPLKEIGRAWAL